MPVSKRLRFEVLRRDGHRCRYCGKGVADAIITVDHVVPTALGGTDLPDNLVAACEDCNAGKTSTIPDGPTITGAADDAVRWARAIKLAAAELEARQNEKNAYRTAFKEAWDSWTYPSGNTRKAFDLDPEWRESVERFRLAGLPATAWTDIVDSAMGARNVKAGNLFRHCCGIARNRVAKLHVQAAKSLVNGQPAARPELDAIGQAATDVWVRNWVSDHDESPSAEVTGRFTQSVTRVQEFGLLEPERLLAAAAIGGCEQQSTINESLGSLVRQEHADIVIEWADTWRRSGAATRYSEPPDSFLYMAVQGQVDTLANHGISLDRIRAAAVVAGHSHSTELHHGLREAELRHTGVMASRQATADAWVRNFRNSGDRWPTDEERRDFMIALDRAVAEDSSVSVADLLAGAAAASAYQDPGISTCLPLHGSVFEAAAALPWVDASND